MPNSSEYAGSWKHTISVAQKVLEPMLPLYTYPASAARANKSEIVTETDMQAFYKLLLDDVIIRKFLEFDVCMRYADKYLIAMVLTYFKRAGYTHHQFTRYNFFVALYLAHDMEEDDDELKEVIIPWAINNDSTKRRSDLIASRDRLWMSMSLRGIVSRTCCEQVIAMCPNHYVWQRTRSEYYGGAVSFVCHASNFNQALIPYFACRCKTYDVLQRKREEYEQRMKIEEIMMQDEHSPNENSLRCHEDFEF